MAFVNSSDISVVLSGGSTNINPNLSLGGDPSSAPVIDGTINNLFDDIQPEESDEGHEDYRCIYFFNDSDGSVFDVEVYIAQDFVGGADVELGIETRNEIQRIKISGFSSGGSLRLDYNNSEFVTEHNSDLGVWSSNLQNSLRALSELKDVTVVAQSTGGIIFDINFVEDDGKRNHPMIKIVSNDLTPTGLEASIATTSQGSPVNTVAPGIDVETTPPGNVGFYATSSSSPITIPRLWPSDGFPLWVRRVCDAEVNPKENDGFQLRFSGQTLEPSS